VAATYHQLFAFPGKKKNGAPLFGAPVAGTRALLFGALVLATVEVTVPLVSEHVADLVRGKWRLRPRIVKTNFVLRQLLKSEKFCKGAA
jgi:hypothetical protein